MSSAEVRAAQIDALIDIVGAIIAVLDIESDAADLWPETMRKGSPEEIRKVSGELADAVSVHLFKQMNPTTS